MTKEWYKLVQKLVTRFWRLVADLRIATVAKPSIKDATNLASIFSHFICSVCFSFVTYFSKCCFLNEKKEKDPAIWHCIIVLHSFQSSGSLSEMSHCVEILRSNLKNCIS